MTQTHDNNIENHVRELCLRAGFGSPSSPEGLRLATEYLVVLFQQAVGLLESRTRESLSLVGRVAIRDEKKERFVVYDEALFSCEDQSIRDFTLRALKGELFDE